MKNLATYTTLAQMEANVRSQTGTLSQQQTLLLDPMLVDIIHDAIIRTRALAGPLLDSAYMTEIGVQLSETPYTIDISGIDIWDINKISLDDSNNGPIPLYTPAKFSQMKRNYNTSPQALFGTVVNTEVKTNVKALAIKLFRGSEIYLGMLTLTYPRIPRYVSNEADLLDLPEPYIPLATDLATIKVCEKLNKPVPDLVAKRAGEYTTSILSQIMIQIPTRAK